MKRIITRLIFGLISTFVFVGCVLNPPPTPTPTPQITTLSEGPSSNEKPIQVLVWDDQSQVPLLRASVALTIPNQVFPVKTTDNSGKAVFDVREELLTQTATFIIQKEGYQPQRHVVTLANAPVLTVYLVPIGATPIPREPTATPMPPTPMPEATPTSTRVPTDTPTPTFTPTPTATPTATPTVPSEPSGEEPDTIATALMNSSIFEEPNSDSAELAFIFPGDYVVVLEQQEFWILVRNDDGIEGWAAANRFDITLGTPTPIPVITAVVTESASIYESSTVDSTEITFINPGVEVRVLGRSANSGWLFIRTENEIEGWVAASRMDLSIDIDTLPVVDVTVQSSSTNSGTGTSQGSYTLDFWNLPGEASCSGARWTVTLFLEAQGGDAPYTYYVNDELVAESVVGNVTKQFSGADATARIYSARVISNSGQVVTKEILVTPPNCD